METRRRTELQRRHERRRRRKRVMRRVRLGLLIFIAVFFVGFLFVSPMVLTVEKTTHTLEDLPGGIGQLKIVYITDFHDGFFTPPGRMNNLATSVNALNADLILLGGDYADDLEGAISFFNRFPSLHSRYGVYAVFGEHDLMNADGSLASSEDIRRLRNTMMGRGVTSLMSEISPVRIGSEQILIAGLDDVTVHRADVSKLAGQLNASSFVVFMAHSPAALDNALRVTSADNQRRWFDLGLFGHTHGGQLALFGQGLGISNVNEKYLRGWRQENRMDILVSNGVGTSVVPMRFFVPPQIHLITVKKK